MDKIDLKGKTVEELEEFVVSLGESPFRARQLFRWIYAKGVSDFELITDISKVTKEKFTAVSYISALKVQKIIKSDSGDTEKFLFALPDGNFIESVLMYYDQQKKNRSTICISSQVGCAQGCVFCASGRNGLIRNLTVAEIVDQVIQIQNYVKNSGGRVHNVVIMGIGEPLVNFDNFVKAVHLINHGDGIGISIRRIAVSTVGIPELIRKFADTGLGIRFAVSLHAPDDKVRDKIMPVNKKYPIATLLEACRYYQRKTGRRVTFEYTLIDGLNDSLEHAEALGQLIKDIHCLLNIIPLNPVEGLPFKRPSIGRCRAFANYLEKFGFKVAFRTERGTNIDAACGQLRLKEHEKI